MHPEEIVHYIRIVKNEKSVLYLTYKIICGRQRLYALRLGIANYLHSMREGMPQKMRCCKQRIAF